MAKTVADPELRMPADSSNDNGDDGASRNAHAHGEAAMLLVESLVHGLIARQVITVADAVEIVDVAADVAGDLDAAPMARRDPQGLLAAVSDSLRRDLPQG